MPEWKPVLLQARLAGLKLSPAREAEIVEELSAHLDDRYRELVRAGTQPAEAERLALAELRDHDLLSARLRVLRQAHVAEPIAPGAPRRRGRRLLAGPPVRRPDARASARVHDRRDADAGARHRRQYGDLQPRQRDAAPAPARSPTPHVWCTSATVRCRVFSYPEYADLRDRTDVFDSFAAWGGIVASLNADATTDLVTGAIVTGSFFRDARRRADARPADRPRGRRHARRTSGAVISHGLWQRRFEGRRDIVGHAMLLNGQPFTIVGVTRPGFTGAQVGVVRDLFVPMMMQPVMRPPRGGYSGDMNPDLLNVRTTSGCSRSAA